MKILCIFWTEVEDDNISLCLPDNEMRGTVTLQSYAVNIHIYCGKVINLLKTEIAAFPLYKLYFILFLSKILVYKVILAKMAKLILTEDAIQLLLKSAQSDTSPNHSVLKFLLFKKLPFFP